MQQEILTNIRKILRSINLESKRIQREHGISIPQLLCLNALRSSKTFQATIKQLSLELSLNSSTVSGIVKRLESKGFVAKLPNPADRRSAIVALTEKGEKLLKNTPTLLHDQLGTRLEKLPPEELEKVRAGLSLLISLLGIESVEASPILVPEENIANEQ